MCARVSVWLVAFGVHAPHPPLAGVQRLDWKATCVGTWQHGRMGTHGQSGAWQNGVREELRQVYLHAAGRWRPASRKPRLLVMLLMSCACGSPCGSPCDVMTARGGPACPFLVTLAKSEIWKVAGAEADAKFAV
jgi:hypothetical protein